MSTPITNRIIDWIIWGDNPKPPVIRAGEDPDDDEENYSQDESSI